ncbi:MAG: tetratricopeptide repeat protein [Polyangiaceae bacterium]|nr:tetratricopeptide repeat protein [Polyangiaceae bacterium]
MRGALPFLAVLILAHPALARSGSERAAPALRPAPDTSAPFYRELRRPGYQRSRTLLRQAMRHLEDALAQPSPWRRAAIIESAITRLELARTRAPDDPEVLFYLAYAVAQWEEPVANGPTRRRNREAIALFERLRELDSDYRASQVALELGVLFTRTGRFERAIEEYRQGIAAAFSPAETATACSNLGEVTMLSGDLPAAIESYERAVSIARNGGASHAMSLVLSLYGLAVALDRYGDGPTALERAREAYGAGAGLGVLRSEGVFFEPAYEIHYYEGLGSLAAVDTAAGSAERSQLMRDSLRSFQRFLAEGGSIGLYASAAERHVRELDARLRSAERSRP